MTMPQNLTELAKQGDPKAIASLMNRSLQPKGITANASSRHDCLQLQLEAAQVPNQEVLVKFVQKGLATLGVESIRKVRVYGYQTGIETPAWEEEIDLMSVNSDPDAIVSTLPTSEEDDNSELPEVEDMPASKPQRSLLPIILLGAIALLLGLGALLYTLYLKSREIPPADPTPISTAAPESATPTASATPSASVPPSPTAASSPFRDAVNKATQAATATQTASSPAQWQQVVQQWQDSIDLLGEVPNEDANYAIAQRKIGEYQRNLDYAKQRAGTP